MPENNGIPKAGDVLIPGQVDPTQTTNTSVFYQASPIYGVRQWQMGQDQQNIFAPENNQRGPMGPQERARQEQLQNLRQELDQENGQENQTNAPENPASNNSGAIYEGTGATYMGTGANRLQTLKPGDNSANGVALSPLPSGNSQQVQASSVSPTAGSMSTQQTNRQFLDQPLPPPTAQSTQYALLRQRLDQYNNSHPVSDEEANREFSQLIQARCAVVASEAAQRRCRVIPQRPTRPALQPQAVRLQAARRLGRPRRRPPHPALCRTRMRRRRRGGPGRQPVGGLCAAGRFRRRPASGDAPTAALADQQPLHRYEVQEPG